MSVRLKLALTVFAAGIVTALLVIATVIYGFQRFEHEATYRRGTAFLGRVVANNDYLFETYEAEPDKFRAWLRNMVLFEPDTQLYLLDLDGRVLAASGSARIAPDFKVALKPVLQAIGQPGAAYVMGDDPERMDANAVVSAQPVRRATMRAVDEVVGYLYLVLHTEQLPEGRWDALRMSLTRPALGLVGAVVAFTTLLSVLIIVSVTRPLRRLTDAVATISQRGLDAGFAEAPPAALPPVTRDEFGQLTRAFEMMLATLRKQWAERQRLDHFRREGVSNLSHDLRSPLTATVACLETLEGRWRADAGAAAAPARTDDRRLVEIALRFAERAAQRGVALATEHGAADAPAARAAVDVELFERAVANLVDNALKFCPPGARVRLTAETRGERVLVRVADSGPGIAAADLPHLFDRFFQSRHSVAPATGEGGRGLGLAIVKRIAELHGGAVAVASRLGEGTTVELSLPRPTPCADGARPGRENPGAAAFGRA